MSGDAKVLLVSATLAVALAAACGSVGGSSGATDAGTDRGTNMATTCFDLIKNGAETDVDCGGSCGACQEGKGCAVGTDCVTAVCTNVVCAAPSCTDGIRNGVETDADCGGSCATKCAAGRVCGADADCVSGTCTSGQCAATCTDGTKDGNESDVDCGGAACQKCGTGKACGMPADCQDGVCTAGSCAGPTCTDQVRNASESDVDCGGSCPTKCSMGRACTVAADCATGACAAGTCISASCADMTKNGDETDVDCGGGCPKCAPTKVCVAPADCAEGVCTQGVCLAATCSDGIKNDGEGDVDCGGACPQACGPGKGCLVSRDCIGALLCTNRICTTPTTCLALKTEKPTTQDGVYSLDPDGFGVIAASPMYCDMTNDGGGWTLVTPALIDSEFNRSATVTRATDARGGLIMTVYANARGCGTAEYTRHKVDFSDLVRWTQIRASYTMAGGVSCWGIFGSSSYIEGTTVNLIPFDLNVDTIRDPVRMGGSAGARFDGMTSRCDNEGPNFWHTMHGPAARSATVVLRRRSLTALAGLATGSSCADAGAGTSSPTWWRYSDIYVR